MTSELRRLLSETEKPDADASAVYAALHEARKVANRLDALEKAGTRLEALEKVAGRLAALEKLAEATRRAMEDYEGGWDFDDDKAVRNALATLAALDAVDEPPPERPKKTDTTEATDTIEAALQGRLAELEEAEETSMNARGQGLVEYALIIGLVAVVAIAVLIVFGDQIISIFQQIIDAFPGP